MKRRHFLHSAAALGAAALAPAAAQAAAFALPGAEPSRFTLLRASAGVAGARFAAHARCTGEACPDAALRVRIDGLQRADGAPVLSELWLSALFSSPGVHASFVAWQFSDGPRPHMGQRIAFLAPRAGMHGFVLDYRVGAASTCVRETCALTSFTLPLLVPGHYALLGPKRDGRVADPHDLRYSGNEMAPLAGDSARDFDCLAFRIEAIA